MSGRLNAFEVGDLLALRVALLAFRQKNGHFIGCRHGMWVDGYSKGRYLDGSGSGHEPGVGCPDGLGCEGDGAPCSKRCAAANRALTVKEKA